MPPIIRQSLHDEVLTHLRRQVVEACWPAGSIIPEVDVCRELQVSRTPVREALKVLAAEGLVELLVRSGAKVKVLSPAEAEQVFEATAAIETAAARMACVRATAADILALESRHKELLEAHRAGDRSRYFAANQHIHQAIVQASGNEVLATLHRQLLARMRRVRFACTRRDEEWAKAVDEHDSILKALRERDSETLDGLITQHLRRGWERVRSLVETEFVQQTTKSPDHWQPESIQPDDQESVEV